MGQQHTVFVSHAHADNALCDRYVAALRARGLDVWYDRTNMQDGHILSTDIERELGRRSAFVVLLTSSSVASYWVNLEVSAFRSLAAQDPNRLMLPVRIADCRVPLLMTGIKWVDAASLGFDAAIDAIATAMGALTVVSATLSSDATPALPEFMDQRVMRGRGLVVRKRYAEAIPLLESATYGDPHSFLAWENLGIAYAEMGRPRDGLIAFDRALALDPKDASAWDYKGCALHKLKRYDEALVAFNQALRIDRNRASAWKNKGIALDHLDRFDEALAAFHQALALEPEDVVTWEKMGGVLCFLGRSVEAVAAYDRALSQDPKYALAWEGKGGALCHLGRYEEAVVAYDWALAFDSNLDFVWLFKGDILNKLRRYEEAVVAFDRALVFDPRDAIAWQRRATALLALGRSSEAEQSEQRARELGWHG